MSPLGKGEGRVSEEEWRKSGRSVVRTLEDIFKRKLSLLGRAESCSCHFVSRTGNFSIFNMIRICRRLFIYWQTV